MKRAKRLVPILWAFALAAAAPFALAQPPGKPAVQTAAKRAITFDDLISLHRISEVQVSPDGKWAAYRVATPDLQANRLASNLWIVSTAGGPPQQLTRSGRDSRPQWSPDGKRLAFTSTRDATAQVYLLSLEGGEASKLTSLSTGADNVLWSPDGKTLAFTSEVYPDCRDDACNSKRDAEREKSKVKARLYDHLLYRHWNVWSEGKRSHLFVVSVDGGTPRDLTYGADYDVPPVQRGDAEDMAFSPDSKEICFTAVTDKMEAISTNGDLFLVPVSGGAEPKRITTNPGFDGHPSYSPDGRTIAYRAQFRAGYEADKWRLMLYERQTGKHTNVNEGFDRSVEGMVWSPDSKTIYFLAEDRGQKPVFSVTATPGAELRVILKDTFNNDLTLSRDGRTLVFTQSSLTTPAEAFAANADGSGVRQLTRHNAEKLAALDLNPAEHFWFDGAEGTRVHAMLVLPPGFDPARKYPFVDGARMAAAGASYGGYMMNWFESQTKGRFKAIVTHASLYNLESMYGATEELWFPEWEMQGTPWTNRAAYEKWSPSRYAGEFGKYKTPTLVTHGELDFRVPYTEGLQMFTALQRQGVPSKLLIFPDEGRWILKPQNSELWYKTVLDWLATYLKLSQSPST